jgi:class 3 adenylate cyclase/tetratricopeptide (TPR) repeat protein
MSCPTCGAEVQAAARFCWSCGQPLGAAAADERRIVTVLFGDIVGFTGLAEDRDPEIVKNLVDTCFARVADDITSFGGQVDKVIGDAIVALFGAPIAHEDDAERAVRAALRVQETVAAFARERGAPIRMRVGVNTGDVLVGRFRADSDYTAMGDTVNIAARLQSLAEPGTVLVGPDTHAATAAAVRYEPVGLLDLKGRGVAVETWRAVEPIGLPGERRTRKVTPVVGRDTELELLRATLDGSVLRRRAHLALLLGDGGVGKTRIAEEVAAMAEAEHDALVLNGRCVPYGEANAWGPMADALRGVLEVEADAEVDDDEFRAAVGAVVGYPPGSDEVQRMTEGLLHLIDVDGPLRAIDPTRAQEEAGRSFRLFLQLAATRRPVVLWLTDLHWADDVVLAMVDAVLTRLPRLPVLVLATARHELLDRWSPRAGRATAVQLSLDPLDRAAASALLDALLPAPVEDAVRDALLDRADGNPFFLEELAASVRDGDSAGVLPDNIRGLVSARLDSLAADDRSLLEDAAVLGRRGSVRALARMGEQLHGWADIETMLRRLDERDLLRVDGGIWSFRSNLVHDVAYGRLTKSERARRHAGVAGYLESLVTTPAGVESVANHYRRAAELVADIGPVTGVPVDVIDRAIQWIEQAADVLIAGSLDAAAKLLSGGLDLVGPTDPRRSGLLLRRAKVHTERTDLSAARQDVADALRLRDGRTDGLQYALAQMRLGEIEQRAGNYDRSLELLADAAARFAAQGELRGVGESHRLAGMTCVFAGRFDEAEVESRAALAAFEQTGVRLGAAWAKQNLAWISYTRGDLQDAEDRIAEAMAAFAELGDRGGIAWSRGLLAYLRLSEGRLDEARAFAREELGDARDRGDRWGEGMLTMILASIELWEGHPEIAARRAERALRAFREMGEPLGQAQASAVLARALVRLGRVDEADRVFEEAAAAGDRSVELVTDAAACAAAERGEPNRFDELPGMGDLLTNPLGQTNRFDPVAAVALGALQTGDLDRARTVLGAWAPVPDPAVCGANVVAVRALLGAIEGDRAGVERCVTAIDAFPHATYTDVVLAQLARGLAAAREADAMVVGEALDRIDEALRPTGDRLWHAVARLGEATMLEALGAGRAPVAREEAEADLDELGLPVPGWRTAFRLAVGVPVA